VSAGLPTAVVIGAQKCGTSALHYYLAHHPGASVSQPKELDFFLTEKNWRRGVDWYASRFDPARPVRVDASPNYTAHPFHRGVMGRMATVLPGARLVYLVRDPLERISAHWAHNYALGRHDGSLGELANPRSSYVTRSCYALQLDQVLAHYPADALLVLDARDLKAHRAATLRRVFAHLQLDAHEHPAFATVRNRTDLKTVPSPLARVCRRLLPGPVWERVRDQRRMRMPVPRPDVRAVLPAAALDLLRADAHRFTAMTGLDTGHWSVFR
jgi:hypothetical protein